MNIFPVEDSASVKGSRFTPGSPLFFIGAPSGFPILPLLFGDRGSQEGVVRSGGMADGGEVGLQAQNNFIVRCLGIETPAHGGFGGIGYPTVGGWIQ